MNEQTAVVIGSSGLTGGYVLQLLLSDESFTKVSILVRKELAITHSKLIQHITDFNDADQLLLIGKADVLFCCVGTTMKKVKGDKIAYEKVDYDIPVNMARIASGNGFKKLLLISSIGASAKSSNFYLRLKGKVEDAIMKFPFESTWIFRPSSLLGKRKEIRNGEKVLQAATKLISSILFGSLKKYHGISAEQVAVAMVAASKRNHPGVHIVEYREIMELVLH